MTKRGRLCRFLAMHAVLLGGALLFLLLDRADLFDRVLFCPLHLFGLYCPTCGMTRAAHALLALDLAGVMRYHPLLPLLGATVLYYDAYLLAAILGDKEATLTGRRRLPLLFFLAALGLFFLLRNLLLLLGVDLIGDFL